MENSGLLRCCFYLLLLSIIKEKSAENLKILFLVVSTFLAETDNLIFVNTVLQLLTEIIIGDAWSNQTLIDCLELTERCIEYYLDEKAVQPKVYFGKTYFKGLGICAIIGNRHLQTCRKKD